MRWLPEPTHGDAIHAAGTMYPTYLEVVTETGHFRKGSDFSTTYGVVIEGRAQVSTFREGLTLDDPDIAEHLQHSRVENLVQFSLPAGTYFSFPGTFSVEVPQAPTKIALITRIGFRGQYAAGSLEKKGRLSYIDGCSDSMLVYPPRLGDPVLNHLHFPPGILQTQHTHPSIRMGVVVGGEGVSWRGINGEKGDLEPFMALANKYGLQTAVDLHRKWADPDGERPVKMGDGSELFSEDELNSMFDGIHMLYHLKAGGVFMLEEGELHSFATPPNANMEIIAYHPDSDWGPTDEDHPMLNRTYIKHGQ